MFAGSHKHETKPAVVYVLDVSFFVCAKSFKYDSGVEVDDNCFFWVLIVV